MATNHPEHLCVCGQVVEAPVVVHWANGDRTYWYCADCASDVLAFVGGTEIDMGAS